MITCGTINGGYAPNIIADKVYIKGTTRSFQRSVQDMMKCRMEQICSGISCCSGAMINMNYRYGYPPTVSISIHIYAKYLSNIYIYLYIYLGKRIPRMCVYSE